MKLNTFIKNVPTLYVELPNKKVISARDLVKETNSMYDVEWNEFSKDNEVDMGIYLWVKNSIPEIIEDETDREDAIRVYWKDSNTDALYSLLEDIYEKLDKIEE